jgi:hypothetical protein
VTPEPETDMDMHWPQRVAEAARRSGVAPQVPPLQLLQRAGRDAALNAPRDTARPAAGAAQRPGTLRTPATA